MEYYENAALLMQDKAQPTILVMKLKHHSCSFDAACVSICCLSQIPETNESVNHEKITMLLANGFHSSKKESQRLPEFITALWHPVYHLW